MDDLQRTSFPGLFRGRAEGFSLLEVMVALAIVAIALVSLMGLSGRSISAQERVQRITQATLLAQQRMTEMENTSVSALSSQDTQGSFAAPFDLYRWRISFSDTPLPKVKRVTLTVFWGNEKKNEAVELISFLSQ